MGLRFRLNLILVATFIVGLLLSGAFVYWHLNKNALLEIYQEARLLMENSLALRTCTSQEIQPLLKDQLDKVFLPQTVPSYSATRTAEFFQATMSNYSYKEAALNPTNPKDLANDWEASHIRTFIKNPEQKEITGIRRLDGVEQLYLMRPIQITDASCLACHSVPQAAPASLLAKYGDQGGFHWQLGEIIGAQIVTVPTLLSIQRANAAFFNFIGIYTAIFLLLIFVINLLFNKYILSPIIRIAHAANDLTLGKSGMAMPKKSQGEILLLVNSFERLANSLRAAEATGNDLATSKSVPQPACSFLKEKQKEMVISHLAEFVGPAARKLVEDACLLEKNRTPLKLYRYLAQHIDADRDQLRFIDKVMELELWKH